MLKIAALCLISSGMVALACSASSGGARALGGGGTSAGAGSVASGGADSSAGPTGGTGAGIHIDAASSGGIGGALDDACSSTSATADNPTPLPADIIWAVDQSGSMNQETAYVQAKINDFANMIGASNIDYHVVMIASTTSGNPICVPPPLSGGSCGNGPRFRLVDVSVDSNDALDKIVDNYPKYSDFLRQNAVKHFVVVTDDDATDAPLNSAAKFSAALAGLQPTGMFAKWVYHSIFAYGTVPFVGCIGAFGTGAAYGAVHDALVTQTSGAKGVICDGDWIKVFQAITTAVVVGSKISCEYSIPPPEAGTLDPSKVNVDYLAGGQPPEQPILRVNDLAGCSTGANQGGWYYDNPSAPTKIILCPQTCTAVQSDPQAKINVKFGCESVFKPPA